MQRHTHRTLGATIAATLALALTATACGDDDDPRSEVRALRVVAQEKGTGAYAYDVPAHVPEGATRLSFENTGRELHHAQLFKLHEDADIADLRAALSTGDPADALTVGAFVGGTSLVAPGDTSSADAIVDLTEGRYVLICFVPSPEGEPHFAHGMLQRFDVVDDEEPPRVPDADVEIRLFDYGFEMPASIAGDALVRITNVSGAEPHEMTFARLHDGATVADVQRALDDKQLMPATPVGGVQAVLPGASQSLQLDIGHGTFVVLCEIPSAADGMPHRTKGMIREVKIT
jgi:hypothetical protein